MKQIDFKNGGTLSNILSAALPMLVAQILNLLYNIVDRIYIARIHGIGTAALGAVGLCFPIVILISAFTNMYGSGGAPLFSIERGRGNDREAKTFQNTSFFLLVSSAVVLTVIGELFGKGILRVFGASNEALIYAMPYLRIYLLGTIFSMIATGMNPFITAGGYAVVGMTTVMVGAVANIILDPIFIFVFDLGVEGAAIATVISQALSALYVLKFLYKKDYAYRLHLLNLNEVKRSVKYAYKIVALGTAAFIVQFTNAVVQISCNNVLSTVGGDIYISIMTIVNSARQMMETPILAITEGTSPLISYNYGARRYDRIKKAILIMFVLDLAYTMGVWLFIKLSPETIIGAFSNDKTIMVDAVAAFNVYFSTFVFMIFQHSGQVVFKSLGMKYHAIFFSLFRKVVIVVPLTYILPYFFKMGTMGVFLAEPISNVVGGLACFTTMLIVVNKTFKEEEKAQL